MDEPTDFDNIEPCGIALIFPSAPKEVPGQNKMAAKEKKNIFLISNEGGGRKGIFKKNEKKVQNNVDSNWYIPKYQISQEKNDGTRGGLI